MSDFRPKYQPLAPNQDVPDPMTRRTFVQRSTVLLSTAAVGGIALSACGDDDQESSSADAGNDRPGAGKTVALILNGINEYTQSTGTGVYEVLAPAGYTVRTVQGGFEADAEVQNFQSAIAEGVDGIAVLPVSPDSAGRGAILADQEGIPTVSLAWAKPSPADDAYAGRVFINNKGGGKLIADWLSSNAEPGGILLVQGLPGNEFSDDFDKGLADALPEQFSIVGRQPGNFLRTDAITAIENLVTANPTARIIVTSVSEMGVGVASYLQRAGRKDFVHVTSDCNAETAGWMEKGFISADNYYSPGRSGVLGGRMLRKFLEKQERTTTIDLNSKIVTAKDIDAAIAKDPLSYSQYRHDVLKAA